MARTPLLLPPTLDEIKVEALKIGLPDVEAQKFFHHYEANGWIMGRTRVKSWTNALAGWKLRWEQCEYHAPNTGPTSQYTGAQLIYFGKELERVIEKMRLIKSTYEAHQSWSAIDVTRFAQLKSRRDELKKILGVKE